jgi:aspartyl-tRNA(Asn)/glutamyl-tRNA(Gln) amidotransferase subunit B
MDWVVEGTPWAKDFLEKRKIPFTFVEHEAATKPVDSAKARGVEPRQIAKALVYLADGKPLLAVLPGSEEVDEERLRAAIGAKSLRMASPEEVKEHTGCVVGLVPPTIPCIRKIIDTGLSQNQVVSFNAGIATAGIIMKPNEMLRALDNYEELGISRKGVMVGLECHVQLATDSKLFCGCATQAEEPNSACCPVCLGHPGSKPVLHANAFDFALKVALAFNCEINREFFFSRKTYFYPDMSKNFQITQYEIPVGKNGFVVLGSGKRVGITRVHLEEDPAALVHESGMGTSNYCLVDYNRSGIPLVEIVTEPDMVSPEEARDFLDQLVTILSYLKVYSPTTGTLKADCNASVYGNNRVEVKNVSGKKNVEKALSFEIERQKAMLLAEKEIVRETRAFDEAKGTTRGTRSKETEEDYGYIFEPDLTAFRFSGQEIEEMKKALPELHNAKSKRFCSQFGLDDYSANVLANNFALGNLFELVAMDVDPKLAANFLARELMAVVNRSELDLNALKLDAQEISPLLEMRSSGKITEKVAKEALIAYLTRGVKPAIFIEKQGLAMDLTEAELEKAVEKVMAENKQAVADLKRGNSKSLNFIVGQVMRFTKAKANPKEVQNSILKKLRGGGSD